MGRRVGRGSSDGLQLREELNSEALSSKVAVVPLVKWILRAKGYLA